MNIDLEKHGLKEVKFSELIDGDEFNIPVDFSPNRRNPPEFYRRKLVGGNVIFADGKPMALSEVAAEYLEADETVFIKA
ncbi:hypothetical protein LCGC14_1484070 [marine sediment metagenome]|uniref:Uncharacterized protein n=1 Tax=marine sediment metagenome TaxID=412755 RepID=A0A0F9J8L8_9ZZZZ